MVMNLELSSPKPYFVFNIFSVLKERTSERSSSNLFVPVLTASSLVRF